MSRLFILVRPSLVAGFHLAGVEAFGVEDVETLHEMVERWMDKGETGLLAIDEGLFSLLPPPFIKKLETRPNIFHIAIPGGGALGSEASRRTRVASIIRRAIGVHIAFKGDRLESQE